MSDFDFNDDEEFDFDDARSAYITQDDLQGRLLLIAPESIGSRTSKSDGGEYAYVEATAHVLDGGTSEVITEIPMVLDGFQFSGVNLTGQLKPKVRSGRKVLGRLDRQPAQKKNHSPSWVLKDPTEADKVLARKYLKFLAAKAKNEDPFD